MFFKVTARLKLPPRESKAGRVVGNLGETRNYVPAAPMPTLLSRLYQFDTARSPRRGGFEANEPDDGPLGGVDVVAVKYADLPQEFHRRTTMSTVAARL